MTPDRENLFKELDSILRHLILERKNVRVAYSFVHMLERKVPKAVKVLSRRFSCIFSDEELDLIGKLARAVFNDLVPDYINPLEGSTTRENKKEVTNIIKFPKVPRN